MPFKKGESGNPGGRVRDKGFTDALRMALAEEDEVTGKRKLRSIAEKLVTEAINGESWAVQMVADRLEGKPVQSLEVGRPGDFEQMSDDELETFIAGRKGLLSGSLGREGKANGQAGVRGKSNGVH